MSDGKLRLGIDSQVSETYVGSAAVGSDSGQSANYLASKAALHEFVRALAREVHGFGMRAAAVLPDTLDTEANRVAIFDAPGERWFPEDAAIRGNADQGFQARHV